MPGLVPSSTGGKPSRAGLKPGRGCGGGGDCEGIVADFLHYSQKNGTVGLVVEFADISSPSNAPGAAIVSWLWNFGDGAQSTQQNPTHTYSGFGPFIVTLSVTDSEGCTNSTQQTISDNYGCRDVFLNPPPSFRVTIGGTGGVGGPWQQSCCNRDGNYQVNFWQKIGTTLFYRTGTQFTCNFVELYMSCTSQSIGPDIAIAQVWATIGIQPTQAIVKGWSSDVFLSSDIPNLFIPSTHMHTPLAQFCNQQGAVTVIAL